MMLLSSYGDEMFSRAEGGFSLAWHENHIQYVILSTVMLSIIFSIMLSIILSTVMDKSDWYGANAFQCICYALN